ncbi:uncharacterized protein LOC143784261 isoform X2 [Ranitomeya variabilis]
MKRRRITPEKDAIHYVSAITDKPGLTMKYINPLKGRGVFAETEIEKGSFVAEYRGELINLDESQKRSIKDPNFKNFVYEFQWNEKIWCIDASQDNDSLGRLVNDEYKNPNCKMKKVMVEKKPHLCLFAISDINPGEEITYNYGDSSFPWREKVADKPIVTNENQKDLEVSCYSSPETAPCLHTEQATSPKIEQNMNTISDIEDSSDFSLENSEEEYLPHFSEESSSETSTIQEEVPLQSHQKNTKTNTSPHTDLLSDSTSVLNMEKEISDSVSVQVLSQRESGVRMYNKKQYCFYCEKPFMKIARHLEHVHKSEPEVAGALKFAKGSKERRRSLEHLRHRGNFAHNSNVIRTGSGVLVTFKQPTKETSPKDFMHCIHCQGLFVKKYLWRHMKKCKLNQTSTSSSPGRKKVQSLCAFMEPMPPGISSGFWKLLSYMRPDEISSTIKSDGSIVQMGQHLYNRIGSEVDKHEYIRQKLREVGRLVLEARKCSPLFKLVDFIVPSNFMHAINSVRVLAGYDEETNTFKIPSLALKLGHSLVKISSILECQAMVEGCQDRVENARNFRKLYETRWNELISSAALKSLKETKWNTPQLLPFTEDVKKMHLYLDEKLQEYYNLLSTAPSVKKWTLLAKVILAQLILFNRRREGEVSKMFLSSFTSRDTSHLHDDVALALSDLEKKLCQHFTRIEIRGKRGRKVPILLTPAVQNAMTLLVEKRTVCGVLSENVHMFARPEALSHFRGCDCIRFFAKECGAKNPETLTSTKLRKHVATLTKVLNLNDTELDQLADFLGHDIKVHRQYYRLPEGTLQLAKISKLLLALEKGRLAEFKGKNFEDISIDPEEPVQLYSDESEDEQSPEEQIQHQSESELGQDHKLKKSEGRKPVKKIPWNREEVKAVEKHMIKFIHKCKVPGKNDCVACIAAEPSALKDRNWLAVKFYIKNRITALKRNPIE